MSQAILLDIKEAFQKVYTQEKPKNVARRSRGGAPQPVFAITKYRLIKFAKNGDVVRICATESKSDMDNETDLKRLCYNRSPSLNISQDIIENSRKLYIGPIKIKKAKYRHLQEL